MQPTKGGSRQRTTDHAAINDQPTLRKLDNSDPALARRYLQEFIPVLHDKEDARTDDPATSSKNRAR